MTNLNDKNLGCAQYLSTRIEVSNMIMVKQSDILAYRIKNRIWRNILQQL